MISNYLNDIKLSKTLMIEDLKMSKGCFVRVRDAETWNEFKEFVVRKHGKLHTALGDELIKAIKEYMRRERARTHNNFSNKNLKKEAETLKKEILSHVEPGGSLSQNVLEGIVRRASGVMNKRSVRDRIETLVAVGFLKRDWNASLEGKVFRVIGDETDKVG